MKRMGFRVPTIWMVVALALSACGTTAAPTGNAELSGTLTVWDFQYGTSSWGKALKATDAAFTQAHPKVKIVHVGQPNSQYYAILQAAFASKSGPDVVMMHSGTFGVLNYTSVLEPLNKYITPAFKAEIPDSGWFTEGSNFDPNGTIYGVPSSLSGWVYYYNKSLFRKAGLDPNTPPTTWDDFVATLQKLKAAGIVPIGGGNADTWGAQQELNELVPGAFTVQETSDLAHGKLSFTSGDFRLVTQKIVDLHNAGFYDPGWASTVNWTDGVSLFQQGKEAIFPGIASDTTSYREWDPFLGADNVGVFYSPGIKQAGANYLSLSSGPVWSMTSYSNNKNLAWAYIEAMTGPDGTKTNWQVGGNLPINVDFQVPADAAPQVKQMLSDAKSHPTFSYVSALMKQATIFEWQKQMQLVLAGKESLDKMLQAVQAVQDQP